MSECRDVPEEVEIFTVQLSVFFSQEEGIVDFFLFFL